MSRRARTILIISALVLGAACAIALPLLLSSSLVIDHGTATVGPDPKYPGMKCLTVSGPSGWTVVTYNVVLDWERKPTLGGRGSHELGLFDEAHVCTNYYPDRMPERDIPLETHVRLFGEASPAATIALPSSAEEREVVGTWVVISEDARMFDHVEGLAPALRAASKGP